MLINLLYTFFVIADSLVLIIWGLLDLRKFRANDTATRIYRRDGLFLVVLGICGFGVWGIGHYKEKSFETQIANANARAKSAEGQVATANAASHDAVARVASAYARIAEANAKAAEANQKAEQERFARIKIEQQMAPRGLNVEQEDRIVAKLSTLKGYQAEFGVTNQTWEQIGFMRELESVFKRAQWSVSENQAEASGPFGAVTRGVLARATSDGRSVSAAFLISNALLAENIRAHVSTGIPGAESTASRDDPHAYRVLIIVGEKSKAVESH